MDKVDNLGLMTDWQKHLKHYGVKGMKWGVRKDASRADKRWGKRAYSAQTYKQVWNASAGRINQELPAFNKKHAGLNLNDPKDHKKYADDYKKLADKILNEELERIAGRKSPSGEYSVQAWMNLDTGWMAIAPGDQDLSQVPTYQLEEDV